MNSGGTTTHDIDWGEVAQFFADHVATPATAAGIMCCPWCDLVANSGGGPTDDERAVIMRRYRKALSVAPFWPAVSAWLDSRRAARKGKR